MYWVKRLGKISRPRFWMYVIGPFLIWRTAVGSDLHALLDWKLLVWLLAFSLPANLFLYGVNDIADGDTDKYNTKKDWYEVRLMVRDYYIVLYGVVISVIILLLAMRRVVGESVAWRWALWLYLVLGASYSLPPARWKARRLMDSLSNALYIMPGLVWWYAAWWGELNYLLVWAAILWAMAMHTYSAVPDIKPDSEAWLTTTAVWLGRNWGLLYCGCCWLLASVLVVSEWYWRWVLWVVYLVMIWLSWKWDIDRLYRWFPLLNALIGCLLFFLIILT